MANLGAVVEVRGGGRVKIIFAFMAGLGNQQPTARNISPKGTSCPPDSVTNGQAMKVVKKYLTSCAALTVAEAAAGSCCSHNLTSFFALEPIMMKVWWMLSPSRPSSRIG